jgi:hypothetical protein
MPRNFFRTNAQAANAIKRKRMSFFEFVCRLPLRHFLAVPFTVMAAQTGSDYRRSPDVAFIVQERPEGTGPINFTAVQNLPGNINDAMLDSYIGASGDQVVVSYLLKAEDRLRIFLVPKSVGIEMDLSMNGQPKKDCSGLLPGRISGN